MIRSRSNALVKQARGLSQRRVRDETGLFVVEGIHPVGEAVEAGWQVESILYAPDILRSDFARGLVDRNSSKAQAVSPEIMEFVAGKDNPQGILAIVRQRQILTDALPALKMGVAVVAPQDPGNLGTIVRTADAASVDAVFVLDGGVDEYHPTAIRAAMGTSFWKPILRMGFQQFDSWRHKAGYSLVGTSAHARLSYLNWAPVGPWILVLGGEQKGLAEEQMGACDVVLSLPMRGRASSLNLAVAAGILLYHFA
jgi:TrmH family RNA methyltransferase